MTGVQLSKVGVDLDVTSYAGVVIVDVRTYVFGVKLSNEDIPEIEGLRYVGMATNFGTKIAITGFV